MYEIYTSNKKVEKRLNNYIDSYNNISDKLKRIKNNPRKECDAHPLKGKLNGKWACWLGSNIRIIFVIDDYTKRIWIESIGTHKIY